MDKDKFEAQSTTLEGIFPCGHIDEDGVVHKNFFVKELTGREEDLLASKGDPLTRLNQVIINCMVSMGTINDGPSLSTGVWKLSASDRMAALIAIRRISIGDNYRFQVKCDDDGCNNKFDAKINLATLPIDHMDNPDVRKFEDTLKSGRIVRWHVMDAKDEKWLTDQSKKLKGVANVTLTMMARIDSIDDYACGRNAARAMKTTIKTLQMLKLSERNEIKSLFKKKEGDIDTEIESACTMCGNDMRFDMEISPSFFFPEEEEDES